MRKEDMDLKLRTARAAYQDARRCLVIAEARFSDMADGRPFNAKAFSAILKESDKAKKRLKLATSLTESIAACLAKREVTSCDHCIRYDECRGIRQPEWDEEGVLSLYGEVVSQTVAYAISKAYLKQKGVMKKDSENGEPNDDDTPEAFFDAAAKKMYLMTKSTAFEQSGLDWRYVTRVIGRAKLEATPKRNRPYVQAGINELIERIEGLWQSQK